MPCFAPPNCHVHVGSGVTQETGIKTKHRTRREAHHPVLASKGAHNNCLLVLFIQPIDGHRCVTRCDVVAVMWHQGFPYDIVREALESLKESDTESELE